MEDGRGHAQAHRLFRIADRATQGRPVGAHAIGANHDTIVSRREMRHGLGHPIEHQPDTHASSEQHREPADVGIVRGCIPPADTHLAQRRNDQRQTQQHENIRGTDEEPGHLAGQPAPQTGKDFGRLVLQCQGQQHEQ